MKSGVFVGVGCVEAQMLPFKVLRRSILARTERDDLAIAPLFTTGIDIPTPRDVQNRPKTPFSFQRFTIPEAVGYRGQAVYLDSDMLVLADIDEILNVEFASDNVLAVPEDFSVLSLDCANLDWNIRKFVEQLDAGELDYDALMRGRAVSKVRYALPPSWNWLDNAGDRPPEGTSLVHFTLTTTQPWLCAGHPAGDLWFAELFRAMDDGEITEDFVEEQVRRGFVRPSLLYQVQRRIESGDALPREEWSADEPFADYCRSVNYAIVDGHRPLPEGERVP